MARSKACPKCQASMSEGFVIDNTYGSRGVSKWVEGPPQASMWVGIKLDGKTPMAIVSWRCDGCGYLEHYAPRSKDG